MKSNQVKERALALYIENNSTEKIAKQVGVTRKTIEQWSKKNNWYDIREEAINKSIQKSPEKYSEVIDEQIKITLLAHKELLKKFKHQEVIKKEIDEIHDLWRDMNLEAKPTKEERLTYYDSLRALYSQLMGDLTLVKIMIHGLEVIRPKTMSQLNFMKQEINDVTMYRFEVENANNNKTLKKATGSIKSS